jgi:cholesterol transport system auxiliary component
VNRRAYAALLAAMTLVSLSGCISVFPKADPVQTYRFGATKAGSPQPGAHPTLTLSRAPLAFSRDAGADRILTASGLETAYLSGARWVAPAQVLFEEALVLAFGDQAQTVRLAMPGELQRSSGLLRVSVQRFEARYAQPKQPPTIIVALTASLSDSSNRALVGEQTFEVQIPASSDSISAIVYGFDQATSSALSQVVAWTDAQSTKLKSTP